MKNLIIFFCGLISLCSCDKLRKPSVKYDIPYEEKTSAIGKWQLESESRNPFVYKIENKASCSIKTTLENGDTLIYFEGQKDHNYLNTYINMSKPQYIFVVGKDGVSNKEEEWQQRATKNIVDLVYLNYIKPGD